MLFMLHLDAKIYSLPCTARGARSFKNGLRQGLIASTNFKDAHYYGEFAPMQGVHHHSVDDALKALSHLSLTTNFFEQEFHSPAEYPASYVLSMMHAHYNFLPLLASVNNQSIKLSALIDAQNPADACNMAHHFLSEGYRCLKIKIGRDIEHEINKVRAISELADKNISLRLDANKKLSLAEARKLMKGLSNIAIQYFEEPTDDFEVAPMLTKEFGVAVAIDESFKHPFLEHDLINSQAQYFIVKPSRFPSLYSAMSLARRAKDQGIYPILSPAYESSLTTAFMAIIVHKLSLYEHAHGLWVDGIFLHNLFKKDLSSLKGSFATKDAMDFLYELAKGVFLNML